MDILGCRPRLLHPIDDLDERAADKNYSKIERQMKCQLAAAYRLVDIYGWSEGIYNHITCRIPGDADRFLINPFGLLFHEITASSLLTVDIAGGVIDHGSTGFSINPRGFTLHSAIHQARPDVLCILHLHVPEVIAVSCTKDGFVPVCQEGLGVGPALLLRNHGFLTCGSTVADAMMKAYFFMYNIRAQLHLPSNQPLILPSEQAAERTYAVVSRGEKTERYETSSNGGDDSEIEWGPGGLDWEANMRLLDSMGLKTGYEYGLPVWRDGN